MNEPVTSATSKPDSATRSNDRTWILQLSRAERSTLIAAFGGWALDGMDVMVYSFVIPSLIAAWHITSGQAGLLGTAALLISAVGGWLAGMLADRYGRVRMLQITIVWFAVFTFLSGFTNSFRELLIVRGLQGLGFGGEWAVGSVLMGETIRARHRGKAVGTVQSGWAIGWAAAAIAYISLFHFLPAAIAWRAMFWIGILPAFLVLYIRRHVSESEIFQETRNNNKLQESGKFLAIFSPALIRTTMLASVMAIGAQGGYYAITTWLPSYLRTQRGLSTVNTGVYLFVVIAGSFAGYLVSAHLADWLGRKRTLVLYAACSFFAVLAYAYLPISNATMLLLGFPLGFFASGSFSPMGAFLTELFPTAVRGTGQGFSYNVGRAIGAVFPALVGYLAATMSVGHAIAVFAVAAYVLMIVAVALLPETKGKDLRADARI